MLSDKLMTLLRSFSRQERTQFRKFLISPAFNENPVLTNLFDWIASHLNGTAQPSPLDKKDTWQHLFGDQPYRDARLRRLCSELDKLAMRFLAFGFYNKDISAEAMYLLPALNKIKLGKHFSGAVRKLKTELSTYGVQNAAYHYAIHHIENQSHILSQKTEVKNRKFKHLERADFHLDCFYIIQKLRHYIEFLMWKKGRPLDSELHFFPEFLNYLVTSKYINEPIIAVHYSIIMVYLNLENENHYHTFIKLLNKKSKYFAKTELKNIYLTAQNYCAHQINQGRLKYYRELFNIYKTLIEKELLLTNRILAPGNYKNIITVGLMVDEPDWVEQFIKQYTSHLPKANQDNDLNYNLAKVYFHQKQYDKVIDQLREVEYKNLVYSLGGKLMLLKTYYELDELNALDSLIDSFRTYLRRNRFISRDVRQQYLNVLRFVRKLAQLAPNDEAGTAKVTQQIKACKALAAKQWLLEKVGERG